MRVQSVFKLVSKTTACKQLSLEGGKGGVLIHMSKVDESRIAELNE